MVFTINFGVISLNTIITILLQVYVCHNNVINKLIVQHYTLAI